RLYRARFSLVHIGSSPNQAARIRITTDSSESRSFETDTKAMDAPLGASMNGYLLPLASGSPVDTATIWDALHAAIVLDETSRAPPSGAVGNEDGES
ncbi:MAG: hypothetical protein ABSG18_16280, partial [Steroidobacteraceae bacterium]